MDKSQKLTPSKRDSNSLYCTITYIWNIRKDKPNLQWQKVDQSSRADGMGVIEKQHKGLFWSDENVQLDCDSDYPNV